MQYLDSLNFIIILAKALYIFYAFSPCYRPDWQTVGSCVGIMGESYIVEGRGSLGEREGEGGGSVLKVELNGAGTICGRQM